jgi:hypothetical protein
LSRSHTIFRTLTLQAARGDRLKNISGRAAEPSTIELVDYSEAYFTHILGRGIPPLRVGKFVQVRTKRSEHIVLAPKGFTTYHADIVERFADSRSLLGMMNKADMFYEIIEPGWWVVGGGYWQIEDERKQLKLGSDSKAYGRFDRETLEDRSLGGYQVVMEECHSERYGC